MNDITVEKMVTSRIPTRQGEFKLCLYRSNADDKEHLALVMGEVAGKSRVLVRVHSECFTGDVISSLRCDCGEQLNRALSMIAHQGEGVLVYPAPGRSRHQIARQAARL
jgi:3,4-dihydroxy 2-butanone 4-phosphate synthase/GTP cyclohydrolase II